jgi:hypothetical protein
MLAPFKCKRNYGVAYMRIISNVAEAGVSKLPTWFISTNMACRNIRLQELCKADGQFWLAIYVKLQDGRSTKSITIEQKIAI